MSARRRAAAPGGALALAAILSGCMGAGGSPGDAARAAEAAVLRTVESYYADLSARNWPAFADWFWPEATLVTLWDPDGAGSPQPWVVTVPEFVRRAPDGPDSQPIFEERLLEADVRVSGDLAQVWARYQARFGDSTTVATWTGVDAFTMLRHEGVWKIASLVFVSD